MFVLYYCGCRVPSSWSTDSWRSSPRCSSRTTFTVRELSQDRIVRKIHIVQNV